MQLYIVTATPPTSLSPHSSILTFVTTFQNLPVTSYRVVEQLKTMIDIILYHYITYYINGGLHVCCCTCFIINSPFSSYNLAGTQKTGYKYFEPKMLRVPDRYNKGYYSHYGTIDDYYSYIYSFHSLLYNISPCIPISSSSTPRSCPTPFRVYIQVHAYTHTTLVATLS